MSPAEPQDSDREEGRQRDAGADRARAVGVSPAAREMLQDASQGDPEGASKNGDDTAGASPGRPPRRSELSSIDRMRVTRGPDYQVEPLRAWTVLEGHAIEFRPITWRDRNRYGLDRRGILTLEDDERVQFLREHMVRPEEFADVRLFDEMASERGWEFDYDDLTEPGFFESLGEGVQRAIRETPFLEEFSFQVIDDLLFTIAHNSRDVRRNRLPRMMDEDEDGAAGKDQPA